MTATSSTGVHPAWCRQPCDVDPDDGAVFHRTEQVALGRVATVQACHLLTQAGQAVDPLTVQIEANLDDEITLEQLDTVIAGLQAFRARVSGPTP